MPYLTGSAPDETCEVRLQVPTEPFFRRAVVGALSELIHLHMWEQFGDATREEAAAASVAMLDSLTICEPSQGGPTMKVIAQNPNYVSAGGGQWLKMTGMSAIVDTGQWDESNQRVIIPADGTYGVHVGQGPYSGRQECGVGFNVNGNARRRESSRVFGGGEGGSRLWWLSLAEGDVLEFYGMQYNAGYQGPFHIGVFDL